MGLFLGFLITRNIVGAAIGFFALPFVVKTAVGVGKRQLKGAIDVRRHVYSRTLYTAMGYLAKADGRISELEIAHAERVMEKQGLFGDAKRQAIEQFRHGAESSFEATGSHDLKQLFKDFNRNCSLPLMRQLLMLNLLGVAMADGSISKPNKDALQQIAASIGFSAAAFESMLLQSQFRGNFQGHFQSHFREQFQEHFKEQFQQQQHAGQGQQRYRSEQDELASAYAMLGASTADSNQVIKRKYRKLMNQYHPDKLMGQGLPDAAIEAATEKVKQLQLAYDLIKKQRNIK